MELNTELPKILNGNYEGLNARLRSLNYAWHVSGLDVEGKFYYLAFKNDRPSVDEFVEVLYDQIIPFCIPRREREELMNQFLETNNYHYINQLHDKATKLFIKAREEDYISGEPGEVALFLLLEAFFKAPQIACKMYLKTNTKMPVHGSDGIHIRYDNTKSLLNLYWGESKFYKKLSSALDDICQSIKAFTTEANGDAPRKRDLNIMIDHMSLKDGELKEEIKKYFNPYHEYSNHVEERFACLVGFDYRILSFLEKMDQKRLEEEFQQRYLRRIEQACNKFSSKICDNGLQQLKFLFLLIPFESVDEVRKKFLAKLGCY